MKRRGIRVAHDVFVPLADIEFVKAADFKANSRRLWVRRPRALTWCIVHPACPPAGQMAGRILSGLRGQTCARFPCTFRATARAAKGSFAKLNPAIVRS